MRSLAIGLFLNAVSALVNLALFTMSLVQGSPLALVNLAVFFANFLICILLVKVMSNHDGDDDGRHRRALAAAQGSATHPSRGTYLGTVVFTTSAGALTIASASLTFAEPKPIPNAGIRAGEIRALRAWRVNGDRLHSIYVQSFEWPADGPARGTIDDYGIHGFRDMADVREYLSEYQQCEALETQTPGYLMGLGAVNDFGLRGRFVIGTVDLWGDVIEHERGYRAEFAAVASLDEAIGDVDLAALRARYGVA